VIKKANHVVMASLNLKDLKISKKLTKMLMGEKSKVAEY